MTILLGDPSKVYSKIFETAIRDAFSGSARVEKAVNCASLLESSKKENFDVVIIDANLPGGDFLGAIKEISASRPKALIVAAGRVASKSRQKTERDAVDSGALVFIEKPLSESYEQNCAFIAEELKKAVKGYNESAERVAAISVSKQKAAFRAKADLVVIAASTGGPFALESVFSGLSENIDKPILVVQHMPPNFTESLAKNLDKKSPLLVKTAEDGETPKSGAAYIAPGGFHMTIDKDFRVKLSDEPAINGVKPSADALFMSVAENLSARNILCVVLTGMGRDGANGVRKIKERHNCRCVAQSEETSVVYGMPRAVVEEGLCDCIADIDDVAGVINGAFKTNK